jgi:archaellum biogenesis ATPase FlaH
MNWAFFFRIFLTNKEVFFEYYPLIDNKMFKNAVMTNLYILIGKFFDKYKRQPDIDLLYILLDKLPEVELKNKKEYVKFIDEVKGLSLNINIDSFKNELTEVIQTHEMEKFIYSTANKINTNNTSFEDMLSDIREITKKYKPKSSGVDVTDAPRVMQIIKTDVSEKVSSGLDQLNNQLQGGYGTNEIAIVIAPPGRGKSFYLVNSMYGAMLSGKNVLYITFELAEKSVLKRLYSRIGYATKKDMLKEDQIMKSANKFFNLSKAKGKVVYFPSKSLTVEGIEAFIEKQEMYFDFKPDMIVVDYLDLIAPRSVDYKSEVRHRLRNITDDLRSIALRRNIAIVTATQANRASLSLVKVTEANTAESFGKVEVADVILAICQTEEEKNAKRARIAVLKNRDSVSGACIEMFVDFERMLLMDLELAGKFGFIGVPEQGKIDVD